MKARIIQSDTPMENEKLRGLMWLMVERLTEILATPEGQQDFENWKKETFQHETEKTNQTAKERAV